MSQKSSAVFQRNSTGCSREFQGDPWVSGGSVAFYGVLSPWGFYGGTLQDVPVGLRRFQERSRVCKGFKRRSSILQDEKVFQRV